MPLHDSLYAQGIDALLVQAEMKLSLPSRVCCNLDKDMAKMK